MQSWSPLQSPNGVDLGIVPERLGRSSTPIAWQTKQHQIKGMPSGTASASRI